MQTETLKATNIKCQGCASNIKTGLSELAGVHDVQVDINSGTVAVEGEGLSVGDIKDKLESLGYPVDA